MSKGYSYDILYKNNSEGFELMENSANALLLQFKEPIKYDLTIPSVYNLKKLLNMYQDKWWGKIIEPRDLNCCFPFYNNRNLELDFEGKHPRKIERGLEFCFNKLAKEDTEPIEAHLDANQNIFSREYGLYRFREGMREKIQKEVETYFNLEELLSFEEIGNFMKPYFKNLDKPARAGY